jgi:prepilin signal peptidase PulO-like enzyme (type II secretory pathway)
MEFFANLPPFLFVLIFFGFGIIIGSFLNVYLYRFHTGKSLSGKSHCLSCGTGLRAYELFPLLSYLALRGRCRTCGSYIPARYFLVELLTGVLFVVVALSATELVNMFIALIFVSILVVIAVYDLYHLIIPDELVISLALLSILDQGYSLMQGSSVLDFGYNVLAATLGSLFFYSLWHYSKGKWIGFGDVKLALPLGIMVGCAGVFSMIVLSFWVGAIIGLGSLAYLALKRRGQPHLRLLPQRLTMKSAIPFAPFLIIGFLGVYLFGIDVIVLLSYGY